VYVSSEDAEILSLAMEFDAIPVQRPVELADNFTYKQEAIVHAVENMNEKFDIIVSMQANSPEISARDVDSAIEKLHVNDRNEIFSVDEDLIQNAAFRIMKYNYVFQKTISTRSGAFVTNYIDVHTVDDVNDLELNRSPSLHYNEVKNV
jgi:CMP-N-acetylneuraminic acid synthetase